MYVRLKENAPGSDNGDDASDTTVVEVDYDDLSDVGEWFEVPTE